jgi:DNA-binding CsgD family transcriptional regulator
MATLMTSVNIMNTGEFLNKWFEARIKHNKNVLLAYSGSTGSGKTYSCLNTGENWYKFHFKEKFPVDNVCFGLATLAKRINELHKSGKLRKGELFILEEAGANFGNLDFQNKISKMFNYILQSFRSMNLIVIMNLPVLTMLNKSARQLIHGHFITCGIDYQLNQTKVKPYLHQLNQVTGKSYWKYPRLRVQGKIITLERLRFNKPEPLLIQAYEFHKENFVFSLTEDFVQEALKDANKELLKSSRDKLTEKQHKVLDLVVQGLNQREIGERLGVEQASIHYHCKAIIKKGYDLEKYTKNKNLKNSKNRLMKPAMSIT